MFSTKVIDFPHYHHHDHQHLDHDHHNLVIDLGIRLREHVVSKEDGPKMFVVHDRGSRQHVREQDLAQVDLAFNDRH